MATTPPGPSSTSSAAPTTIAPPTTTSTVNPPSTASPSPTSTSAAEPASDALRRLPISDGASSGGYSRELFPTWLDLDSNGCDARDDTLAAESEIPVQSDSCTILAGRWTSIYDGRVVTEPSELDVDHMVPLAEAWRSGASTWSPERRAQYANYLDYTDHLIAVTASANRSKSDSPPDQWRPPAKQSWCRYATAWITIKAAWTLTITTPEREALGQMLDNC